MTQDDLSLFKNKETYGLIQNHISEIENLEEEEAILLISKYARIRQTLRDRLDLLGRDTFSAQRLRGALVQVEAALLEMEAVLKSSMIDAAHKASIKGVDHLIKEINKFNEEFTGALIPIDIDAVLISQDVNNLLLAKYEASLRAYTEGMRSQVAGVLTNAAIEKANYADVIHRMSLFFRGEEWKLHRIARTELSHVYNYSKQLGMFETKERYVKDLKKTLIHPIDHRTGEDSKHVKMLNLIVDIEKPFHYTYKGKDRIFMTPPDRPNDRSIMVPYRDEWE